MPRGCAGAARIDTTWRSCLALNATSTFAEPAMLRRCGRGSPAAFG
jgi:hypothetical protein